MSCLLCGKGIPLLRQLRGSSFCSEAHEEEYTVRQSGPPAAEFAPSPLSLAPPDARPDTTIPPPIPRFSDVVIDRRRPRVRDGMGVKGARSMAGLPQPVAPAPSRAIGETSPAVGSANSQILPRASLSALAPSAPHGFSVAGIVETAGDPAEKPVRIEKLESVPIVTAHLGLESLRTAILASPHLLAGETTARISLDPIPADASPKITTGAIRPRHRIRGPGSRQSDPVPPELAPRSEAPDPIPAALGPGAAISADAPLPPLIQPALPPPAAQEGGAFLLCDEAGESLPVADRAAVAITALPAPYSLREAPLRVTPLSPTSAALPAGATLPLPPAPQSSATAPIFDAAPIRARQHFRGPGARQYKPALRGLRAAGEAAEISTPADTPAKVLPGELKGPKMVLNPPAVTLFSAPTGAPASPELRADGSVFPLGLAPEAMPAVPLREGAAIRSRQHLRGPGARQHDAALEGLRSAGHAAESFEAVASPAAIGLASEPIFSAMPAAPLPNGLSVPAGVEPNSEQPPFRLPPDPQSMAPAPIPSPPARPRQHIRGPGARQCDPPPARLRLSDDVAEMFDAVGSPAAMALASEPILSPPAAPLPSAPGLPAGAEPNSEQQAFLLRPDPASIAPAPILTAAPARPRQHIRGPGAHQYDPAPPKLLLSGEAAERFSLIDSPPKRAAENLAPCESAPALMLETAPEAAQTGALFAMSDEVGEPFFMASGVPAPRISEPTSPLLQIRLVAAAPAVAPAWGPRPGPGIVEEPNPTEALPLAAVRFDAAEFPPALRVPIPCLSPDLEEPERDEPSQPCGFAGAVDPPPFPGVSRCLSATADFAVYPVWLPSLFTLAAPNGGLRPVGRPDLEAAEGFPPRLLFSEGPGFSGSLELPSPGAADTEFIERWRPLAAALKIPPPRPPLWKRGWQSWTRIWQAAGHLWSSAPAFVRGMVLGSLLAAPALLFGPKIHPPKINLGIAPAGSGSFAAAIAERATIDLREDFQFGLGAWRGKPGWEDSWVVDSVGSAEPGRLALFVPSARLTDYRVELEGYIEAKALGFAFRAADPNNYYAVRIAIKKPGPLPSVAIIRYAVIDGREDSRNEAPITLYLRDDTFYRILLTVEGEHFGVSLNGQLIDAWSDSRLKSGGIGLFADKGEKASIRSVHLVENDDFLGKLCSQVSQWTADRRTIGAKHE